jgi:Trypsin-co-occurring domain 1
VLEQQGTDADELMSVEFDGHTIYLAVRTVDRVDPAPHVDERQIVARERRFEDALAGIAGFAKQVVGTMQTTRASKVTVEFGCEIAVESGSFVAVIGKASAKSTMTVSLEWTGPPS